MGGSEVISNQTAKPIIISVINRCNLLNKVTRQVDNHTMSLGLSMGKQASTAVILRVFS